MGCQFLFQEIFPTQGLNPDTPHCVWVLYCLNHQENPRIPECVCEATPVMSNSLQPCGLYIVCRAPQSMGFSRQEYWSGFPFPSPGDLPNLGSEPSFLTSPALVGVFFTTSTTRPPGKPKNTGAGSHPLLQGIFPIQGSNQGLLHCRQIFLPA